MDLHLVFSRTGKGQCGLGVTIAGAMKLVDQSLEFYKEFKPGFLPYDVYIPKGTDSVWMYDQAHHRLLLDHHQLVTEFRYSGKRHSLQDRHGQKKILWAFPICALRVAACIKQ